jgi:DMSO/TMAO reductase YedYZ heme-binding membrane subunit
MVATRETFETAPPSRKAGATAADAWMAGEVRLFGRYVKRQTIALWVLGIPAFTSIALILPADISRKSQLLDLGEASVLGTGTEILLLLTLMITPLVTVTRQRWFVPLRRWYGLVMAATAFFDAANAAVATSFNGGVLGRLSGHSFLVVGLFMNALLIPLFLTGNPWAQRKLGRYWKPLHKLIYVIWGALFLHLMLLEGFGVQSGLNGSGSGVDGTPIFHQRLYQLAACSLFPFVLRLPAVKRWVSEKQNEGRQIVVFWAVLPMLLLFGLGFAYILHEEFLQGINMFLLKGGN